MSHSRGFLSVVKTLIWGARSGSRTAKARLQGDDPIEVGSIARSRSPVWSAADPEFLQSEAELCIVAFVGCEHVPHESTRNLRRTELK